MLHSLDALPWLPKPLRVRERQPARRRKYITCRGQGLLRRRTRPLQAVPFEEIFQNQKENDEKALKEAAEAAARDARAATSPSRSRGPTSCARIGTCPQQQWGPSEAGEVRHSNADGEERRCDAR